MRAAGHCGPECHHGYASHVSTDPQAEVVWCVSHAGSSASASCFVCMLSFRGSAQLLVVMTHESTGSLAAARDLLMLHLVNGHAACMQTTAHVSTKTLDTHGVR